MKPSVSRGTISSPIAALLVLRGDALPSSSSVPEIRIASRNPAAVPLNYPATISASRDCAAKDPGHLHTLFHMAL